MQILYLLHVHAYFQLMLVVVFVSEGKLQSSGDNQQWIQEERRRGGESPSAAIQFNCLMSGHQETFQLITSAVAVSRSCLPRTHQHCYCQCPPSSWRPPPSIFALNALGKNLQVKIILAMEYHGHQI